MQVLRLFRYHNYKVGFGMRNLATVLSLLFIGISVSVEKNVNIYIDRKRLICPEKSHYKNRLLFV